jgi:hypothetical protein
MIERRKHRRILTLKNFCWAFGVFAVIVIALSFDLFARRDAPGEYGRLVGTELPRNAPITPRPQVVTEAPVDDQTAADPLLLAPAAREQEFLSTTHTTPVPATAASAAAIETRGSGVNIVGDSGGVTIVRGAEGAKRPVLSGGIFKQP